MTNEDVHARLDANVHIQVTVCHYKYNYHLGRGGGGTAVPGLRRTCALIGERGKEEKLRACFH